MKPSEKAQKELPRKIVLAALTSFSLLKQNFSFGEVDCAEELFWSEIHLAYLQGRVDATEKCAARMNELNKAVQS